jgi:hypothetical protein
MDSVGEALWQVRRLVAAVVRWSRRRRGCR